MCRLATSFYSLLRFSPRAWLRARSGASRTFLFSFEVFTPESVKNASLMEAENFLFSFEVFMQGNPLEGLGLVLEVLSILF